MDRIDLRVEVPPVAFTDLDLPEPPEGSREVALRVAAARDEAVLIKCYDSMEDGRARFTAHTAFDDPTTPPDAPPRESIEARTLVFFPPEG